MAQLVNTVSADVFTPDKVPLEGRLPLAMKTASEPPSADILHETGSFYEQQVGDQSCC